MATVTVTVNASTPSVVTLPPVADAFVWSGVNETKNYGASDQLRVKLSGGDWGRESFLKFDLTGESGTVTGAKLTLTIVKDDNKPDPMRHNVSFVANDSWTELTSNGLTWATKPAIGAVLDFQDIASPSAVGSIVEFDVTSSIQGELGGFLSLAVTADNGAPSWIGYASRDHVTAAYRPKLEITFAGGALLLESAAAASSADATSISTVSSDLIDAAAARWLAAGLDISALSDINVQVRDLNGDLLGFAPNDTSTILIDRDAAGRGWFVDQTPWDDYEFDAQGFSISDDADGVDLLSVLTHEMGHVLGLSHDDGVMSETLGVGERRLPSNTAAYDFALASMLEDGDDDDDFWR